MMRTSFPESGTTAFGKIFLALLMAAAPFSIQAQAGQREIRFEWQYDGEKQQLDLKLPTAAYDHYKGKRRTWMYAEYVNEDPGWPVIAAVTRALRAKAREQQYDHWQTVNFIVAFVQGLAYRTETGEYPRYPIETLMEQGGDCEDTAVLLAAILSEMGYDCVLLSPPRHMALGLAVSGYKGKYYPYKGKRYYYIETTGRNWAVGEVPEAYAGTATVYELSGLQGGQQVLALGERDGGKEAEGESETVSQGEKTGKFADYYRSRMGK